MPFTDSFSYRYKQVLEEIIQAAAKRATEIKLGRRPFATPRIVSDGTPGAFAISDKIVEDILYSHLSVGDMTFNNPVQFSKSESRWGSSRTSRSS